jgi:hypothetical protein
MKDDTSQDVMRAGRNASVGLKSIKAALQDTEAIAARMQDSELQIVFWSLQKRMI